MSIFFRRGKSGTWFLPAATLTGPTVSQITAGVDLSIAVTAISGFERTAQRQSIEVQAYPDALQVASGFEFGDAQITILDDDGVGSDADSLARRAAYAALVTDAVGFIVMSPRKRLAPAATKVDIYPCTVANAVKNMEFGNTPASVAVSFNLTGSPAIDVAVAA